MKISELIESLQKAKEEVGDLDLVIYAGDEYLFENTILCDEIFTLEKVTAENAEGDTYLKLHAYKSH